MIQVWLIDEKGFLKKDMLVEEILPNMVTTPILEGYVKPRWTGTEWQEGATEEEIKNWEEQNKIDICLPKSNEELQEEIEALKSQLDEIHERLCTQQEMSSTVMQHIFTEEGENE